MADITIDEMLAEARGGLARVTPENLQAAFEGGALVVDVRDTAQREEQGELPGAHIVDLTVLEWRLSPTSDTRTFELDPGQQVVLVCSDGYSSSLAAARLQQLGVPGATDLEGGYRIWSRWRSSR